MTGRWIAAMAMVALGLVASRASAGPPTDQVKGYTEQIVKILDDQAIKDADKRASVRKVAGEVFAIDETARRALGPHWQKRTPAEQEEFVQLFADLLERTYISKIGLYGGERVKYVGEKIDGDFAVVQGRVLTRKGSEIPVDARLLKRGDRWLIYDITIENVSLIQNYRAQFDRIIRTSSFDELMKRLKTRKEEFFKSS